MVSARVILPVGCAGSGKSTYVRKEFPLGLVISADQYFEDLASRSGLAFELVWDLRLLGTAHSLCQQRYAEALGEGQRLVIVDNTNVRAADRQRFVKKGLDHGYEVEIHVLSPWRYGEPSLSPEQEVSYVALCHGRNIHGVPLEVIAQQFSRLELPSGVYRPGKPAQFLRPLPK